MKIGPKDSPTSQSPETKSTADSSNSTGSIPGSTPLEQAASPDQEASFKASQQNAAYRKSETELRGALLQKQIQYASNPVAGGAAQKSVSPGPALSEFSQQIQGLMQKLRGSAPENPILDVARKLEASLSRAGNLSLPPEMDARSAMDMTGSTEQMEEMLHAALSAAFARTAGMTSRDPEQQNVTSLLAHLLSQLQGQSGESPLGYPQRAFDPSKKLPGVKAVKNETAAKGGSDAETATTKPQAGAGGEAGRK